MGRRGNWVVQYSDSVGVPHPVSEWRRVNLIYLNVREPGVRTWISVGDLSTTRLKFCFTASGLNLSVK